MRILALGTPAARGRRIFPLRRFPRSGKIERTLKASFAMPTSLALLEAEALMLSPEDRALLADHLLASLTTESEVEEAWAVEVERRIAEIESGRMSLAPVEQAIARARQALA